MFCNWIFPSPSKELKLKKPKKKSRNEYPSRCTQNRHFLKMYADVSERKQRKPGGELTMEIDISVQYIYIKYKI